MPITLYKTIWYIDGEKIELKMSAAKMLERITTGGPYIIRKRQYGPIEFFKSDNVLTEMKVVLGLISK